MKEGRDRRKDENREQEMEGGGGRKKNKTDFDRGIEVMK